MSFLNWRERWALTCRLKLKELFLGKAVENSPPAFRRELLLGEQDPTPFAALAQPWQERDFRALDPAWQRLAEGRERRVEGREPEAAQPPNSGSRPSTLDSRLAGSRLSTLDPRPSDSRPLFRAYIERPRGHAKTSDMAVQIAWILLCAKSRVHGLAAAADRDQASLIWDAVRRLARANPRLCRDLVFRKHLVTNPRTDSRLEVISSDVQSSWGALPDFVICDELCHWEKPDLWFSLLSSAAKRPHCVLVVLTNAGVGRGWQWEVREAARNSDAWYFSTLSGPQAPWITPASLREQQELLPRPVYQRLWQNVWQHSDGEFVTLEEAQACRDDSLTIQNRGQPRCRYVAAIDYAEKHDRTVGVVIHQEQSPNRAGLCEFGATQKIIVDRMDVAVPTPDRPVKIAWVEDWMNRVLRDFHDVTFILDEYQLLGTIQKMESRADIHRFEFAAGRGNHALALNLRRLIIHREIAWYPACGQLPAASQESRAESQEPDPGGFAASGSRPSTLDSRPAARDDLETELASLLLKQSPSGRCRIDHLRDNLHHDDRAFALGAACLHLSQSPADREWLQLTPPTHTGTFNW